MHGIPPFYKWIAPLPQAWGLGVCRAKSKTLACAPGGLFRRKCQRPEILTPLPLLGSFGTRGPGAVKEARFKPPAPRGDRRLGASGKTPSTIPPREGRKFKVVETTGIKPVSWWLLSTPSTSVASSFDLRIGAPMGRLPFPDPPRRFRPGARWIRSDTSLLASCFPPTGVREARLL